jgi:outer membrane protein
MKSGLIFNIVLLILVGVLFFLHFSGPKTGEKKGTSLVAADTSKAPNVNEFRIAYFELDSVTNSFAMIKDVKNELNREEDKMSAEMSQWQKRYNDKLAGFQSQAQQMSQVQSENANREMLQLQETIRNKKNELDQRYQNLYMQKMQDVRTKIQEYLKDYNRTKGFAYIIGYEPTFIYYKDSVYNITNDIIRGLNATYSSSRKK